MRKTALLHLASGVGNIVLTTPLLLALSELDFVVDVLLDADYPPTIELLRPWSLIRELLERRDGLRLDSYSCCIPAVPPFYWPRSQGLYHGAKNIICRPPDVLFYQNEQQYYLAFARTLGFPAARSPFYSLPIAPSEHFGVGPDTLVIAPGCKTGEMALKRWPFFPQLAQRFQSVALVGTHEDMHTAGGKMFTFPSHVKSFVDQLSLRETAELMAAAGAVVGNDSGLCHVAGAVGTPTLILFGPTPHHTLGNFPGNVRVLRTGLPCEPCWFTNRFHACQRRIDCLHALSVSFVEADLRYLLGATREVTAASHES